MGHWHSCLAGRFLVLCLAVASIAARSCEEYHQMPAKHTGDIVLLSVSLSGCWLRKFFQSWEIKMKKFKQCVPCYSARQCVWVFFFYGTRSSILFLNLWAVCMPESSAVYTSNYCCALSYPSLAHHLISSSSYWTGEMILMPAVILQGMSLV